MASTLTNVNFRSNDERTDAFMWLAIHGAPFDRDIELAVIDREGPHSLVFPCRRVIGGWIDAETAKRIDVRPTHWREWRDRSQVSGLIS